MKKFLALTLFLLSLARVAFAQPPLPPAQEKRVFPQAVYASNYSDVGPTYPAYAIDNDPSTHWSASGDAEWIGFELPLSLLNRVCISFYNGKSRAFTFDVEVSDDISATMALISQVSAKTDDMQCFAFTPIVGHTVLIIGHGNDSSTDSARLWNSYTEVWFYAQQAKLTPAH